MARIPTTNVTLSATGYGSYQVLCDGIHFGMNITSSESTTRNARVMYTQRVSTDMFSIDLVFIPTTGDPQSAIDSLDAFSGWLAKYMQIRSDPVNTAVDIMQVVVPIISVSGGQPSGGLNKYGEPQQTIFGGSYLDNSIHLTVPFQGTIDTDSLNNSAQYKLTPPPGEDNTDLQFDAPAGGSQSLLIDSANTDQLYSDAESTLATSNGNQVWTSFPIPAAS